MSTATVVTTGNLDRVRATQERRRSGASGNHGSRKVRRQGDRRQAKSAAIRDSWR